MDPHAILFWILALFTGISAISVVVEQNIVRAATWLLFALAGTSGIFFLLQADFVGATQLLVYVGGTLVLVVFGVMLTAQGPFISMKVGAAEWAVAAVVGFLLFGVLAVSTWTGFKRVESATGALRPGMYDSHRDDPAIAKNSAVLGEALLGIKEATPKNKLTGFPALPPGQVLPDRTQMAYLLPFEIVSVHLLVVLIGAAYLARAKRRRGTVA